MAAKDIEVKVKYIPDTSALKSAMSGMSSIDFKTGNSNVKKELVAPVQAAMKEVNKALTSGADSATLLQLFQKVGKEADAAKTKASAMLSELNTVFNSSGNQKLLKDLEEYRKKISQTEKQIENWDKKFGNATMKQMKTDLYGTGKGGVAEARKEIASMEEQLKIGEQLTQQDEERLALLKKYVSTWNERQAATPKNELESQLSGYKTKESDILSQVQTPAYNVEKTKEYTQIMTQAGNVNAYAASEMNKLNGVLKTQANIADEGKKELAKFGDVVTGTFLGTSLGNLFQTGLSRGIQFFKEYDETLTRTMMVTGMTRDEVNGLTSSYNKLANQLSSTTKDVAAAQLVFYQQGLGTKEAMEMTEASIAISKTGGIEAGEAANRLTAAVRGYQLAASDSMTIADKMSALDAAAASSVDELTVAMQKSASQARMAGLDLDYYMAYLSTMQEVTREAPENIGTAMKSITSRMQEIRDIGKIEEDGTTFSNVAKALNSIGIAATDSTGQLRSLQDIMNELGPMWATLDRNHKAYIATTLAGNRQQSRFIALMDNYDRAMELVNVSQNASGESAKQLRAYNQGLEASFTALSNAWQQFATKLADSEVIKTVVDLLTDLIEMVNKLPDGFTKTVVPLGILLKTLTTLSKVDFKSFKGWALEKTGIDTFIKQTDGLSKSLTSSTSIISKWGNTLVRAFNGIGNNTGGLSKVSEYTDAYTNSLIKNSASMTAATAASIENNAAHISELGETQQVAASETQMAEAYDLGTAAIERNQEALDANDMSYTTEQMSQMNEARFKINEAQGAIGGYEKSIYEKFVDRAFKEQRVEDAAKSKKSSARLEGAARKRLEEQGKEVTRSSLTKEMNVIAQEIDVETDQKIAELRKSHDEFVNEINEEIKKQKQIIEESTQKITELKTQGVKKNQPKTPATQEGEPFKLLSDSKKTDFGHIKDVFNNQNIGNIAKAKTAIGELGKTINMTSISSGIMIGSMVNMGAQTLGLDEDLSGALGTFTGLGKTLSGFGPWGWVAAAAIAGLQFAFKKLYPSVEEVQEELTELASTRDEITQKISDVETAKKTYEDLRTNINKTEEEQEEFNNAIETLQKEVPGAVSGYDSMGNAIINLTKVTAELNTQQEKLIENSKETLKTFDKLQKAEGSNGWTILGDVFSVLEYITNPIGKITEDITGEAFTASGLIQRHLIEPKELEARKKVWAENFDEIYSSMQTLVADSVDNGTKENQALRQQVSDSILSIYTTKGLEQGLEVTEVQKQIEALYDKFHYGDIEAITNITQQVKVSGEISNKSWKETEAMLKQQLSARLKSLDLTDEEYNAIFNATITMSYAGNVDLSAVREQIEQDIRSRIDDVEFNLKASKFMVILEGLDPEVVSAMDSMGLLKSTMAEVFDDYENYEDVEDIFRGINGEIDKEQASLILLDKALGELQTEQEAHKLEGEDGLYAQEDELKKQIEAKKKEIEELENEKRQAESYANSEVGYGYYSGKLDNQINPALKEQQKELEKLEADWASINKEIETSENKVKDYQDVVNSLVASFESVQAPSFDELAETIRDISSELKSVQDLAASLDEQGGKMSLDNIADMFDIIGNYEEAAMSNAQTWDLWNNSIEKINNGLQVQNGELVAQESVMEGLNNLTQINAKLKMQEIQASIEQNQLELELQNAALKTQAAAIEAAITELQTSGDTAKAKETIDTEMAELSAGLAEVEARNQKNKFDTILSYTSQFATQYSKIMAAAYSGKYTGEYEKLKDESGKIMKQFETDLANELKGDIVDGDTTQSIANLENRLKQINGQISINNKAINNSLELKKKISAYLADDSTNLAGQVDKTTEAQKEYNEKLERTLTLLEKIAGLQHTIDENETFKSLYEGYDGESYGRIMMSNLKLAQEQYGVYKDLFAMQQEMTNQAAGDLLDSPYGEMFTIAENGDLGWASDEMYDKYKGLPEDMQEDIDNLVDAYQNQRDELRDTEQELAVYAEAVKKAREELVEMEIEIENELVDALKNREKIMHEARTKAIEDEIKMIEEAVEARKKAREEDESEKELFQAQEALRRATLDSSGKNNAQLLQLQQDLEDKQLEISEKRFEDDMEDRKNWLQDTKDAETETYEYRLETMTWYWENVQAIQEAGQEAMMQTLIHWNEEYRKTSDLQQREMEREWQFTMDAMRTATDMGAELEQLTNDIVSVTSEVESMNISIDKLPGTWQKATDAANRYTNAAKQAASYKYNGGSGDEFEEGENENNNKTPIEDTPPTSKFKVGDRLKSGAGAIIPYKKEDGKFKQKSWLSAMSVYDVTVDKVEYYNGTYYYKVKDADGDTAWFNGHQLKKYATGGIVDYTGPAWVDGTSSKPEAFLNAYQTQQVGALAEALDSKSINSANMNSNVTFGSINFNVASMSSAADGKKALEMFVQGANDLMAKKGIGTKLNMNVK